jgi:tetratricopeptide (TPR) repeat protein
LKLHTAEADGVPYKVQAGRAELANGLATAVMNKGVSLWNLGRNEEALTGYDEAIAILRPLVQAGRPELAKDLAAAVMNKALVLEKTGQIEEALLCYEESISLLERCVTRMGMQHLLPDLMRACRYRLMTLLELKRWRPAADDVRRFHSYLALVSDLAAIPNAVAEELRQLVMVLRGISSGDKDALRVALGEDAQILDTIPVE